MRRNRNGNRGLTRRQALAGTSATASMILAWRPQTQAAASPKVCILTEAGKGRSISIPSLCDRHHRRKAGRASALMLQVVEDENCAAARVDILASSDGLEGDVISTRLAFLFRLSRPTLERADL